MSALMTAAAAAGPLAAGWPVHAWRLRRRIEAARRDPLTGLWTREPFEVRARRHLASTLRPRAVVLVDLNDFKAINDVHGHAAGDAVITATGRRLNQWAADFGGTAGRLGGDEFAAVICTDSDTGVREAMTALLNRLDEDIACDGQGVWASAAVGVALTSTYPGAPDLPHLLRRADEAMYAIKQTSHGRSDWLVAGVVSGVPTVNGRRDGRRGTDGWEQER